MKAHFYKLFMSFTQTNYVCTSKTQKLDDNMTISSFTQNTPKDLTRLKKIAFQL